MNESLELENIEKEFISIFNVVVSKDLSIEECRKLTNKLVLLTQKIENLDAELVIKWKKKMKKVVISSIISSGFNLICFITGFVMLIFANPSAFLFWIVGYLNSRHITNNNYKIMQEINIYTEMLEKIPTMEPLINNCITFLNKKIDIACNIIEINQDKEQKVERNEQNIRIMVVNNLVYSCIYNDLSYNPLDKEHKEIAIRILQSDLNTEEMDLSKLITMAREKVQKESDFTRTLHKK